MWCCSPGNRAYKVARQRRPGQSCQCLLQRYKSALSCYWFSTRPPGHGTSCSDSWCLGSGRRGKVVAVESGVSLHRPSEVSGCTVLTRLGDNKEADAADWRATWPQLFKCQCWAEDSKIIIIITKSSMINNGLNISFQNCSITII